MEAEWILNKFSPISERKNVIDTEKWGERISMPREQAVHLWETEQKIREAETEDKRLDLLESTQHPQLIITFNS